MAERLTQSGIILPVDDALILPDTMTTVTTPELGGTIRAYLENTNTTLIALPMKEDSDGTANPENFHHYGVVFTTKNIQDKGKNTIIEILLHDRVEVTNIMNAGEIVFADYQLAAGTRDMDRKQEEEILGYLKDIVREISGKFRGGQQYIELLDNIHDVDSMIVWMARYVPMTSDEKYEYLKMDSMKERSFRFMDTLLKQKETVDWNIQIHERLNDKSNKYYRDQALHEQMKAIQEELGENPDGSRRKKKNYKERIEAAGMPDEIRDAALDELDRLNQQQPGSAETNILQNYLDFMLALPWKKEKMEEPDLNRAEEILNADHYGLDKVKKRILEHLAVMKLRGDNKGSILLLVGPPGTGKTSLGKSIAKALNRKYIRISLGGIRDESEIRGHRRTYVGAMPGRILNTIKQAGVTNPVMVLDEVDKLMSGGFNGDPSSALLEVLDPEQNSTFTDHYLNLPYDLSDVFFIATANTLDTIPAPLLDRMEVIQISSYTDVEKFHIAKEHLIPEALADTGLTPEELEFDDDAIRAVIADYTREGGVRGLKKKLTEIARSVSADLVKKADAKKKTASASADTADGTEDTGAAGYEKRIIRAADLEELLGRKVAFHGRAEEDNPAGVVTGLAWTQVGGEILFIEAQDMPGTGQVILTGKLGDVMQESARISLSLLKSRLPMDIVNFKERDIHIHVPEGAVPKDGPSAGITIFTALASLFTGHKVDPHLAMTGEVTLRGAVMPIGGLKEKLLAAQRAGITKALIPKENIPDLAELPEEVKAQIEIIPVATVEDVLRETIGVELPRPEHPYYTGSTVKPGTGTGAANPVIGRVL
ncbi:MAG: endopeptidase La [Eubacterium sp.]|nr:endopeptidase La [Eubacterium sp.]